jgi:death-on-curing family protein
MNINSKQIIDLNKKIVNLTKEPHSLVKNYLDTAINSASYYDNIFDQESAIVLSLVKNHNFAQGNKRTAAITLATLLPNINFTDEFLVNLVVDIIEKNLSIEDVSKKIVLFAKNNIVESKSFDYITKHKLALEQLFNL